MPNHNFSCQKCECFWTDVYLDLEEDTESVKCPECKGILQRVWQPVYFTVN